jgi:hypothetical protein
MHGIALVEDRFPEADAAGFIKEIRAFLQVLVVLGKRLELPGRVLAEKCHSILRSGKFMGK